MNRPPQLADVAARAGVSISLVSRVLSEDERLRIRADTRERVLRAVKEMGYVPHGAARALRRQQAGAIGLVVHDVSNPVYGEIVRGAQLATTAAGYVLLLCDADGLVRDEAAFRSILSGGRIDGMLMQAGGYAFDSDLVRDAAQRVPTVLINSRGEEGVAGVRLADEAAAAMAVAHLVHLGHRRIGYLSGRSTSDPSKRRYAGYREALRTAGIRYRGSWVTEGGWDANRGREGMLQLLDTEPRVTAVLVTNVLVAVGALTACRERAVSVPGDMSIITIHDSWFAEHAEPALTTVRLPLVELGRNSVETLLSSLSGTAAEDVLVSEPGPELVVRASCGPV